MPFTVTSCSSRVESTSGGAATADGAPMSAAMMAAVAARRTRCMSPPDSWQQPSHSPLWPQPSATCRLGVGLGRRHGGGRGSAEMLRSMSERSSRSGPTLLPAAARSSPSPREYRASWSQPRSADAARPHRLPRTPCARAPPAPESPRSVSVSTSHGVRAQLLREDGLVGGDVTSGSHRPVLVVLQVQVGRVVDRLGRWRRPRLWRAGLADESAEGRELAVRLRAPRAHRVLVGPVRHGLGSCTGAAPTRSHQSIALTQAAVGGTRA